MGGFGDLGAGGVFGGTSHKANLGSKGVETEDERKSSCETLRAVLAVLLVVAVCQNTALEIEIDAKVQRTRLSDLRNIFAPLAR